MRKGMYHLYGCDFNTGRIPVLALPAFDTHSTQRNEADRPVPLADIDPIANL